MEPESTALVAARQRLHAAIGAIIDQPTGWKEYFGGGLELKFVTGTEYQGQNLEAGQAVEGTYIDKDGHLFVVMSRAAQGHEHTEIILEQLKLERMLALIASLEAI